MQQLSTTPWFLLALVALFGVLVGRWTAQTRETRAQRAGRAASAVVTLEQLLCRRDDAVGGDVRDLIGRGQHIGAMERVRETLGLGLKEAKDLVDHIRDSTRTGAAP